MRDPRLEQHPAARKRQDVSNAAARLAEADVIVGGLAEWCGDVLFGTDLMHAEDQGQGLSVLTVLLTTRYPDEAFRRISNPEQRQSLEAGFRALIERHEHPGRDVMEWLFGQALMYALEQNSERIGSLLPKLWNIVKYDILVGSSFVESLRDLLCRSASARRVIVDMVESRITDINADPGLGAAFAHDREELTQVVDAWRTKPSTDRLREHLFTNYEDDLLGIVPGILPAARTEIIDRLDRLNFPHPIQQVLFRTSITHDRDEISAILNSAPACSDDGRSWNHRLLALLVLKAVDDHCDALWRSVYRADNSGRTELLAIKEVKATLLPWFKQLGSIVMTRADAHFLGPQWLFMKIADERLHRAHYGIERQRPAGGIPQAELIEWIALGLANAGLTASLIADRVDFSALPPGGKIAPSRPTSRDHAHDPRLSALFAMCLVDHVSDNSRDDAEWERLCLLDRMLASRDSGFEAEANIGAGVDSLPASYFGYLVANVAKPAERWRQSWDLLVEQRRRVQHWENTTDSDALAPSIFLLGIGISGVGWLLSPPETHSVEAQKLWCALFDGARECWLTMTLSHLSESLEIYIHRLFCWHPIVFCDLSVAEDTSETSIVCSGEEYGEILSDDLDLLGGDHLMLAICILNASRNGATPAIMNDVLKRHSGRIDTLMTQFEQWQKLEREVRKRPDIVAELGELKASIATLS